jgi:beta-glucosidase/6-phospho-beta-glucosidase/beta-galactosidase
VDLHRHEERGAEPLPRPLEEGVSELDWGRTRSAEWHDPNAAELTEVVGQLRDSLRTLSDAQLRTCLDRYWTKFRKPIIITENGVCDESDFLRLQAIQDYAEIIHRAIHDGIDVRGYYFWSTWDNFEWHLGPSMRFGLYECDINTKRRIRRPSGDLYAKLAYSGRISLQRE